MKPTLVVSTCGTSILTNVAREFDGDRRKKLNETANLKEDQLTPEQKTVIEEVAAEARKRLQDASPADLRLSSAELNGLVDVLQSALIEPAHIALDAFSENDSSAVDTNNVVRVTARYEADVQLHLGSILDP